MTTDSYPSPLPGEDKDWSFPPGSTGETTWVHMVRHGLVDNPSGRLYGRQKGFRLAPEGEQHAKDAAEFLKDRDITAVYSSPLMRAQQTAYPIAHTHGLEIITNPALIEAGSVLENELLTPLNIVTTPRILKHTYNIKKPSWGEHYWKMVERSLAALHRAVQENRGHEAVCVTHECVVWITRLFVEERSFAHNPGNRQVALGSVTSFKFDGDVIVGFKYREPGRPGSPQVDFTVDFE
ncbi:MAG TPA: histidine phosphatase family protein [Corynebacteriales bacterium]|nr:histidine phosphatase family protein [Mycobacteriales bacterium]